MPTFEVSSTHFFRETGQKVEVGETVELTDDQAGACNVTHPGLLKPVRQTAQASPKTIRVAKKPALRKSRARR